MDISYNNKYDVYIGRIVMKPYVLNLTDSDHKRIKLEATERGITMKEFIMICIKSYLEVPTPHQNSSSFDDNHP